MAYDLNKDLKVGMKIFIPRAGEYTIQKINYLDGVVYMHHEYYGDSEFSFENLELCLKIGAVTLYW